MASGISKAKGRRNSKTKASACRAKLGLPAKAGKRRPHNIMKDKQGNYILAPFVPRPREEYKETPAFTIKDVQANHQVIKPTGHVLNEGLAKIAAMKYNNRNTSDPFMWRRMACHYANGLLDL